MRLFLLAILLLPSLASAAPPNAQLAYPDAPRDNRFETLRVTFTLPPTQPAQVLAVQDARGGPILSRCLSGPGEYSLLFPLPYVGSSTLTPGIWPLRITTAASPQRFFHLRLVN